MKKRGRKFGLTLAILVFIVSIASGCQSIGGVDVNKALLSSIDIQSMEGSGSVEVSFGFDETAVLTDSEAADLEVIKKLNHTKLRLDQIKQESPEIVSLTGALEVERGETGFEASITPETIVISLADAQKPFVIDVASSIDYAELAAAGFDLDWLASYQEKAEDPDFLKPYYTYLLGKLPNPDQISVQSSDETIAGETVSLNHIQAALDAEDAIPLLRAFILNVMQDDAELKKLITQYYDTLEPILTGYAELLTGFSEEESSFLQSVKSILKDQSSGVEVIHTEVKQLLVILLFMLEDANQEELAGKDTSLTVDLYVDSDLLVRKTAIDLTVAPESGIAPGVKSLNIKSSFENSSVNQPVKAAVLSADDAVSLDSLGEDPELFLNELKPESVLYKLLQDDLHITRKTAYFPVFTLDEELDYYYGWAAYNEDGVTMVPLRSLASQLELDFTWDSESQSVLLTVPGKEASLLLTRGSTIAAINGETVELTQPPVIKGDSLYVPLRDTVEQLGGKVYWDPETEGVDVILD